MTSAVDRNLQVEYRLSHEDFSAFTRFSTATAGRSYGVHIKVVVWILLVVLFFVVFTFAKDIFSFISLDALLLMGGTAIFVSVCFSIYFRRGIARQFDSQLTAIFADDGLHFIDGAVEAVIPWEAVLRIGRSPKHLFFVYGYKKGLAIPTRCVSDPAEIEAILERAKEKRPDLTIEVLGRA